MHTSAVSVTRKKDCQYSRNSKIIQVNLLSSFLFNDETGVSSSLSDDNHVSYTNNRTTLIYLT